MKKLAICYLLLLLLMTACAPAEEQPPTLQNGFVSESGCLKYYDNGVVVSFPPGVQEIGGKPYYVEADGVSICSLTERLAEKDGQLLFFTEDCSLRRFDAGFVALDGDVYYAPEDGYALLAKRERVVPIDDMLFAFDADCRVMELSAGVQDVFGTLYYVPQDGAAIARPPAGPLLTEQALYYANADGTLATEADFGYLHFGADGRYTSGSEELDALVEDLLTQAQVSGANTLEDFRLCYSYIRDHFRYLSMPHYPAGSVDWAQTSAETFFRNGKGNCYCWAAAQMYCARRLGIQAYVVAGWEDENTNDHAWMMAQINGAEYLFDAELEYALLNIYGNGPVDMFMTAPEGGAYNGFRYYFP